MKAHVYVTLKPSVLDPQGTTVKSALESLGFKGIQDVRMGKYVEVTLSHTVTASAKKEVERMCQKLLANPVIEQYHIELKK
jgi:phosphoribosylformylglycinamidine synthase